MFNAIYTMFGSVFSACTSWFNSVILASKSGGFLIGAVAIYLIVRYLVYPLVGSSGSDKAQRKDGDDI